MNERIRELVAQSTTIEVLSGRGFDETQYTERFNKEKFAQLIVEECLFIIDDERKPEMVSRIELWKQVKQHFGV